jgi:MerR family transcriptional regulator, redox-sensitive transcriptional activator SoxR
VETLPISEVARQAGIRASAIRYYEAEGLLESPDRSGGWRVFPPDVVDRLKVIRMARELGFTLDDIRTLLNGFSSDTPPSERWQELARRKLPEVDALIQRATTMKRLFEKGLRCDCVSIQDCILYDCNPPVAIGRRPRVAG